MLKVCLKETIVLKMLMSKGDVVLYNEQLWQADTNIEAQDVPNMSCYSSNVQAAENDYDAPVLSDISHCCSYMMRGNYSMPNDSTDLY